MTTRASTSPPPSRSVRWRAVGLTLLLSVLSLGIAAGPATAAAAAGGTPAGKAWVRAGHLVPGLGAARIDLVPSQGGDPASVQMSPRAAYGHVTAYRQVVPGTYQVQVRLASSASASSPMLSRSLTLVADKAYTLAVLGTSKAPRLAVLSDDLTPPSANAARVRVLPASSQAPQVSIVALNGPTIADDAVLGQASSYTTVPSGTWRLKTSSGQMAPVSSSITVASGSVYTLVVLDGTDGGPRLDLITDAAGSSAAPKGGAQTGSGAMAQQFVGEAPAWWRAGGLWLIIGAALLMVGGGLLGGVRLGGVRLIAARLSGGVRRRAARV